MEKLVTREENFSERYNQLAEILAEHSDVRGCMVIKPYGYAIWERMQSILDAMFKATGHSNAYFPLFIPKSYLAKEADHVDGFAKECAVVTHYRLKIDESGKLVVDPEAKLEEELIVRPTSETIIWNSYKKRIQSYRDLPILINQWANVVRREMRTRTFLRTAEFLRQEWHTAHATYKDAEEETMRMLQVYLDFFKNVLAIDPVAGMKSESEKFAGAHHTYTLEAYMQDGKALQSCTSHHLGQNFAKAFDVQYKDQNNEQQYVRATSRGASTRMMGGIILSHSDDKGLVLPPVLAPIHVIIIPIFKTQDELKQIQSYIKPSLQWLHNKNIVLNSAFGTLQKKEELFFEITDADLWYEKQENEINKQRVAVRAILIDDNGDFWVAYVRSWNYYKLPWGGVEEWEDLVTALKREVKEEAGVDCVILKKFATIVEHRSQIAQVQISHIYIAKIVGEKWRAQYTEKETSQGFETQWLQKDKLLALLNNVWPASEDEYIMQFMTTRERIIWENYIEQTNHALTIPLSIEWDLDNQTSPGRKYAEYEMKWIPLRIAVGMRDLQNSLVEIYRRDTGEKSLVNIDDLSSHVVWLLDSIQKNLLTRNKKLREKNTVNADSYEQFKKALDEGKFVLAHRDGSAETEAKIKEECQCVTRCIPFDSPEEQWVCVYSWKPSSRRVLFARAY